MINVVKQSELFLSITHTKRCYVVLTLDQSVATATSNTLHEACRLGDAEETQRLLDTGTNINARDQVRCSLYR